MEIKTRQFKKWMVVEVNGSVDALNTKLFVDPILAFVNEGKSHIAIDLSQTSFLSLPAIKFLQTTARMLAATKGGVAVVTPNERTKRHLEIFASFKDILCCADYLELEAGTQLNGARAEYLQAEDFSDIG